MSFESILLLIQNYQVEPQEDDIPPMLRTPEDVVDWLRKYDWSPVVFTPPLALHLARDLRAEKKWQLAQAVVERALAEYPDNAGLCNEQGHLYCAAEKYDQAVDWFYKTIKATPQPEPDIYLDALDALHLPLRKLRRFEEATDIIHTAIAANGGKVSGALLVSMGWLCFYQKFYAEALAHFAKAEKTLDPAHRFEALLGQLASQQQLDVVEPLDPEHNARQLVSDWIRQGISRDEIISLFVKCNDDVLEHLNLYPAALDNAEHFLQKFPNHPKGIYFKISALKWLRRYAEAEQMFVDAPPELQTNVEIWNERANNFFEQKQYRAAYRHSSGKVFEGRNLTAAEEILKTALEKDPDALEWTIVALRKMRRFDEAQSKINEALTTVTNKLNFLCEQGAVYYAKRDYDNAIKAFDRALKLDDYDTFALQWRAGSLRKKKNFAEAQQAIDEARRKNPAAGGLWEEHGWIAFDQGKLDDAVDAFDKAIDLDPYMLNRQFAKVEALVRLNRSDEALDVYKKLDQQFPDDPEIDEQLCWCYLRAGQLELAREQAYRIRAADPNSVLGLNALGGYELERRDYPAAEKAFRQALIMVDYEPQYLVNLALALVRQVKPPGESLRLEKPRRTKLIEEAKERCRAALKLDPYNARAYGCLGVVAFKQEAFLDAEVYFRKSIELNPTEGSFTQLASLYCQMGRYEDATARLKEALKLNQKDARVYIELGNVAVAKEDSKEALRVCREAVLIEPRNSDTYRALAIALMHSNKYEEAEAEVRKAIITLSPSRHWRLYLLLAQILIQLGDVANKGRKHKDLDLYEEALRYVNEAKQASPPHADIFFHEGIVQHRLEDYGLSQKSFVDCLNLNASRFDAERYGRIVQTAINQQKKLFTLNQWFGIGLAIFCVVMLMVLWGLYIAGHKRTILVDPKPATANANASVNANTNAAPDANANVRSPAVERVPQDTFTVTESFLTAMTPILLGLLTIGALLPNLTKLKLPGFEAEVSDPKPTEPNISTGPRGDIGFGTSLPIVDPDPR